MNKERYFPDYLSGLSKQQVAERLSSGLVNTNHEKITKSNSQIIKDNFFTLFNFYNFVIAFCLFLVGAYSNMLFILIILINIFIGIAQEVHAKNLVEELSLVTMPRADVIREGKQQEVPVEDIVLDDVLVFDSGKQISADSIVMQGRIEVNESLLTGEPDSIKKHPGDLLLSGSFVVSGKCYAKAEHVGLDNYATKIAHEAKKHKAVTSELLSSMRKVTHFTSFLIIPLGIILFVQAFYLRGGGLEPSTVSTAAGLLGMLPKGLVLLISIALASGVIILSRKKVLVQELFALESLAHVDVLCLDKTGTITEGRMSVQNVHVMEDVDAPKDFVKAIGCFLAYSDDNNATYLALKGHFALCEEFAAKEKIAFSSQRKWSAMTFDGFSLVLGAPDRLAKGAELPPDICEEEKRGSRILLATYTYGEVREDILPDLVPWAYIAINDPVRDNAAETLNYFKEQGVDIKIVSGDNPLTVSAVSQAAGLEKYYSYIDMSDVTDDEDIDKAAKEYTVFGRVSPYQKKRIISALKTSGHTVAMTGDGVNDVLALREADCSIALAEGSDAARQVSKLVLLSSDFASLLCVLGEGRRVVNNITRIASIFFVKTVYSLLLTVLCVLFNVPFPFIPLQITLIDITIEGYPSFFMSFEKNNKKVTESFLRTVLRRSLPNAIVIMINILLVNYFAPHFAFSHQQSVTVMFVLIGVVSVLAVYRACLPFNMLRVMLLLTSATGLFGGMFIFGELLQLAAIIKDMAVLILVLAVVSFAMERILAMFLNKILTGRFAYKV